MDNSLKKIFRGDVWVWGVFLLLLTISSLIMFSASSSLAYRVTEYTQPIFKHVMFLIGGFFVVIGFTHFGGILKPTTKAFRFGALLLLILSWVALLYVMFAGVKAGDSARHLDLGYFSVQPSEFAKIALLIVVADIMDKKNNSIAFLISAFRKEHAPTFSDKERFWWIIGLTGVTLSLIAPENLSTALLLGGVIYLLMWIDGLEKKKLALFLIFIVVFGGGVYGIKKAIYAAPPSVRNFKPIAMIDNVLLHRMDTWESRMVVWWNDAHGEERFKMKDSTRQIIHAQRAIARGAFVKFGPGTSIERDFLAEAYSDFLYAIIIEEYGVLGGIFVIVLYMIFFIRSSRIAFRADSQYKMILTFGLAFLILFQAIMNMAVSTSLMPVTGQPLPLLSKGGTATLILSAYFGIILRFSIKEPETEVTIIDDNYEYKTQVLD